MTVKRAPVKVRITVYLPLELDTKVRELAYQEETTLTALVIVAVENLLRERGA